MEDHAYPGYIKQGVRIGFNVDIVLTIPELWIICHSKPLLILGMDILNNGRHR